jgi:lipopolysaccharide transport system ATP-binding protein
MNHTAIRVEGIGKKYRIGHAPRQQSLREAVTGITHSASERLGQRRASRREQDTLWALDDVSFEIKQGEIAGIIGHNGSGKSTLLKVLSRITEPTRGQATINGRVGSLLEVGTGFHPELTGRENVYLNGAMLGMRKREIDRRFDEIIAFADIQRLLDTPVKRYSSGMYVRLAFAVAAHLEPEILLVDEVLAVGDAGFQKKCLGKMGEVAGEGRTVLLVSHNMGVIQELCRECLLLSSGHLVADGPTAEVVSRYLSGLTAHSMDSIIDTVDHPRRPVGMIPVIQKVTMQAIDGRYTTDFAQGDAMLLSIYYDGTGSEQNLAGTGFHLRTPRGVRVGGFNSYMGSQPPHRLPRRGVVRYTIHEPVLTPGRYVLSVSAGTHQNHVVDRVEGVMNLDVHTVDVYGTGYLLTPDDGVVALRCDLDIQSDDGTLIGQVPDAE